ncbi:hypothetical protein ACF0H5_007998 [Mactra antiquata]
MLSSRNFVGIFVFMIQVYHLYGFNTTVDVTVNTTSINLQWSIPDLNSTYVIFYNVHGATPSDVTYNETVTLPSDNDTGVTHTISGLSAGQTYLVEMKKDDNRIFLDDITTEPLPVENVDVSRVTSTSVYVTWLPSNQSIQDSYKVFIHGITNTSFTVESESVTESGVSVSGLIHSHNYSVSVVTYSNSISSQSSEPVIMNTAPLPPSSVTVVAIDTSKLNVTWEISPDSIEDGYILSYTYNSTSGDTLNELTVNVTCSTSNDLYCVLTMPGVPGQIYEIKVHSKLGTAVSSPAMMMHSTVPLPVTSLDEILSNKTSLHLEWTLPNDTDYYLRHFIIEVTGENGVVTHEINGDQLDLPLIGLNVGSMYNISIVVSTGYETSQPVIKTLYTHPAEVERLSNNVYQDATNDSITVYWSIPDNTTLDNYIIDILPVPDSPTFPLTLSSETTSYQFNNLLPGTSYIVSMVTRLSNKQSDPVVSVFKTYPNKPRDLSIQVLSGTEVFINWTAPSGGSITDYHLTLSGSSDVRNQNLTGTSYTFDGLIPGTQYLLKLETQSGGLYSEPVRVTFTTNPRAVTTLEVTMWTSSSVTLSWTPPINSSFDMYEISISPEDVLSPITLPSNVTELTYTISSLKPGILYTVTMVTVSSGVYSESMSTVVVTAPLAVSDLLVEPYLTGLLVTWKTLNTSKQSGFTVSYQEKVDFPTSPVQLPVISYIDNQLDYSTEILNLLPGGTYTVMVQAWQNISGATAGSSIQHYDGTTQPKPVEGLTANVLDSFTIKLDWDAPSDSSQGHYVIKHRPSLRNPDALWVTNSTQITQLTLSDLFPGEKYEIEVYTVSNSVSSDVMIIHVVIAPLSPRSVSVLSDDITLNSIKLQWWYNDTATYVQSWLISYHDDKGSEVNITMIPDPPTARIIEYTINNLVPGFTYNMSVQAVVLDFTSDKVTTEVTTEPRNNMVPSFNQRPTYTSFILDYTIDDSDYFDQIIFTVTETNEEIRKDKSDIDRRVEFTSLNSGNYYNIQYKTVSGDQESEVRTIQAQTLPRPPVLTGAATAEKITLTIQHPVGGVEKYHAQCYSPGNVIVLDKMYNEILNEQTVDIYELLAYTTYTCYVSSIFGDYETTANVTVTTKEAAPSTVRDLLAIESNPTVVTLTWTVPQFENGAIQLYMVDFEGGSGDKQETGQKNVTFPDTTCIISDLKAGYVYTFHVRALTVASSMPSSVTIALKTYRPPYRDGIDTLKATPKIVDTKIAAANPYKILMNFTNAFSDKLGEVIQYTVIVTEDRLSQDIDNMYALPDWKVARQDPNIKAYQVIRNCSTFFDVGSTCDGQFGVREKRSTVQQEPYKVFEIGSETDCENKFYCNGPLKPDTVYYVTLRAYTTMQHRDTPLSEPIRTAALPVVDDGPDTGVIVGIVVGILVVIILSILFVILVIVLRRRMQQKSNMYRHQPGELMSHRSSLTNRKSCCPVNIANFKQHIISMRADSDFKYAEQFEDLKEVGRGQACTAAELACNRGKNRFTNILPYDHSRVKLLPIDDEEGSDYINANYIPGHNSRREYVVTQGPLPATRDDFWRMLWEQNARNIVMLTKCIEKGREKCDKYWPTGSDAVFYGDLQVATLNETLFPDWTVTEFRISLGEQSRQIRHFHFTSWPDFGVPKKEQVLVRFVRMVREKLIKEAGPIIVHCSAGVGRSGTFVVLDRLLQHIKIQETVDIFSTVAELRKERVWMVQTEQQYICIHNCLLCVLEGREDEHTYDNVGHSNIAFEDDEGVDLNG